MIIYLHGFASSVHSSKATYLGERLRARGIDVRVPDLNEPDFPSLTVTRMLDRTRALMDEAPNAQHRAASTEHPAPSTQHPAPVTLFGSSLGGFVAVNAAAQWPDRIDRLVLLAPALDFSDPRMGAPNGASLAEWERDGRVMVFHFGYGRVMPINYSLYEDARRYDALHAKVDMPILVFQGRRDAVVNPASVERWALGRPNVELHLLDDDHQLAASLPQIWSITSRFLDSPRQSAPARS